MEKIKKIFSVGAVVMLLANFHLLHAQKPATPYMYQIGTSPVVLNYQFVVQLPSGMADSLQIEIDTNFSFNSASIYKNTLKTKGNSWKFMNPKALRINMHYYIRVRAFANSHTASDWTPQSFNTLQKIEPFTPAKDDLDLSEWRVTIQYYNPGCQAEYQISDTSDFNIRTLFSAKLFADTVTNNPYPTAFGYNLRLNRKHYLRTRLIHNGDTGVWFVRTFFVKPNFMLDATENTHLFTTLAPLFSYFVSSNNDSLFEYQFEIADNVNFNNPEKKNIWKIREMNLYPIPPGTVRYVRYRVFHNGMYSNWSNVKTITCLGEIPAITVVKDFRGFSTLQFTLDAFVTRIQIDSDTTLKFNSYRRKFFDSSLTGILGNYLDRDYKDWVTYRNMHTRYRFGDGNNWSGWSAPVSNYLNPVIKNDFNVNQSLNQRMHFDTLPGAKKLIIQCDIDSLFNSNKLITKEFNASEWSSFFAFPDIWRRYSKLYFRLIQIGNNGASGWSNTFSATQNCVAEILNPVQTNPMRYPDDKLLCRTIYGARRLKYQVSRNQNFNPVYAEVNNYGETPEYTELIVPLDNNTTVYVRAKFYNNIDSTEWSKTQTVTIEPYYVNHLCKPILMFPLNNTQNASSKNLEFVWNAVPEAYSYLIEIYNSVTSKIVYSNIIDSTRIMVPELPGGKALRWQVIALGNKNPVGFSETFKFSTDFQAGYDNLNPSALKIWPNPASNEISTSDLRLKTLHLYDISGKLLYQFALQNGHAEISAVPPGAYICRLSGINLSITTRLLISR